jgi:hypothetical protein
MTLHSCALFLLLLFLVGWTESTWYCGQYCPIVPAPDDRWWWLWSNWWNEDWQGKPKYSGKTSPSDTLSTTNPTWPDPCANLNRRGGKPASNRLSYGASRLCIYYSFLCDMCLSTVVEIRRLNALLASALVYIINVPNRHKYGNI